MTMTEGSFVEKKKKQITHYYNKIMKFNNFHYNKMVGYKTQGAIAKIVKRKP